MTRKVLRVAVPLALLAVAACAGKQEITKGSGPLHEACADGNLEKCHQQAVILEAGGVEERRAALTAFQFGCLLQHPQSCAGLSRMYGDDGGPEVTDELRTACDGGEPEACVRIGDHAPRAQAVEYYDRACAAKHGNGCHKLAQELRRGWVLEENVTTALELDEQACEYGSSDGCLAAGQAYLFGSGVDKDETKAFGYFDKTCNNDVRSGCKVLGVMFEKGIGVTPNTEKANEYYQLAGPDTDAVADSPASAYIVFVDACNRGNYLGCFDAAWFLEEGVSVDRNITTSRELFEKACEGGVAPACARAISNTPDGERG